MKKILVFDMDGTIADLYGVDGWLNDLRNENTRPYEIAKPMYEPEVLNELLQVVKLQGWEIVVTTWLAKGSTKNYDNRVAKVKKDWLDKYNFPYDEFNALPYGMRKTNATINYNGFQILIDDNKEVRKAWNLGDTINANKDIITEIIEKIL